MGHKRGERESTSDEATKRQVYEMDAGRAPACSSQFANLSGSAVPCFSVNSDPVNGIVFAVVVAIATTTVVTRALWRCKATQA